MADELTGEIWREDDPVNHPSHYTAGDVECIDAIKASMDGRGFAAFLKGQVMKYMWRYEKKRKPLEDLEKAGWYLTKLMEFVDGNPDLFAGEVVIDYSNPFISGKGDEVLPEIAEELEKRWAMTKAQVL